MKQKVEPVVLKRMLLECADALNDQRNNWIDLIPRDAKPCKGRSKPSWDFSEDTHNLFEEAKRLKTVIKIVRSHAHSLVKPKKK